MSYNYGPLASKAVVLIAKYGKTVTLTFDQNAAPADANKPWRGPDGLTSTAAPKGLVVSFEKDEIDGERIRTSDIKLLLAAQDPALVGRDIDRAKFCTVNSIVYAATDVSEVEPGDTKMLHTLRLRIG